MTDFGDDDFFGGSAFSSNNGSHFADFDAPDSDPYGYGEEAAAAPVRRSRQRRASIGTPVSAAPAAGSSRMVVSRTNSSDDVYMSNGGGGPRTGGRRRDPSLGGPSSSNRSTNSNLDGHFDHGGGGRSNHKTSERSIMSSSSGSAAAARRSGRRASLAAGASSLSSRNSRPNPPRAEESYGAPSEDYGYDYDNQEYGDMGYGDTTVEDTPPAAEEPQVRSRRQRRCSIADVSAPVVADYGYGDAPPDAPVEPRPKLAHGISNMAIPMTAEEPKKSNRRGSIAMLGQIGRGTKAPAPKEAPEAAKKPDRDRLRQGGLLDRVGAAESRGASRNGTTSYSDRIMSK